MNQKCESCGMPLQNIENFGLKSPKNKYCKNCTDKEGNLKSYNEKINDFKRLLMKTGNYDENKAIEIAKDSIKQFPAWKND